MIQLQALSKGYTERKKVLDHISLELKKGEFLYVLGGTGAGKSTLLRLLATEEEDFGGQLSLFGYDLARASGSTLQAIRRSIGYVPQNVRLIPDFTVFENVALGVSLAGSRVARAEVRGKIYELLDRLQLMNLRDASASRLSGGEAQRVAIARALARGPELLIADEPTGAQDFQNTWNVMDLLHRANISGTTLVLATHDRDIVRKLRKRCAILSHGKVMIEEALCSL
ncbi:MAG: ATP-binding cassette domain-containing protein [Bdellovibrionales bacterium]|nr:ATP-binding cassette domain-containing protein [Bdellovibrionales bacterium]